MKKNEREPPFFSRLLTYVTYLIAAFLLIGGLYLCLFIPSFLDAQYRAKITDLKSGISFESEGLVALLSKAEQCDRFYAVENPLPDVEAVLPAPTHAPWSNRKGISISEQVFLVRLCENSSITLDGERPWKEEVAILGISRPNESLATSIREGRIVSYSPTNGTKTMGDAIVYVREGTDEKGFVTLQARGFR